jgi:hypothetical protein
MMNTEWDRMLKSSLTISVHSVQRLSKSRIKYDDIKPYIQGIDLLFAHFVAEDLRKRLQ